MDEERKAAVNGSGCLQSARAAYGYRNLFIVNVDAPIFAGHQGEAIQLSLRKLPLKYDGKPVVIKIATKVYDDAESPNGKVVFIYFQPGEEEDNLFGTIRPKELDENMIHAITKSWSETIHETALEVLLRRKREKK